MDRLREAELESHAPNGGAAQVSRACRAFVSYSRADIIRVLALVSALRQAGLQTWIDVEDLKPGDRWKDAIETALASAHALIFCISPLSVESAWTSVELKAAVRIRLKIVPVMVRQVELQLLPPSIREQQVLDMQRWPARVASTRAAMAIAAALGVSAPAAADASPNEAFDTLWVSIGARKISPLELTVSGAPVDQSAVKCCYVDALTDTALAEAKASASHAKRVVVVIGDRVDMLEVSILISALAALVSEWRLTVVECCGSLGAVEHCAALSRAHYVRAEAGEALHLRNSRVTMEPTTLIEAPAR
jgi:TIR domain